MNVVYTFHLFAGAGGGILADLLLGNQITGAVEKDSFAREILLSRQKDGILPPFPIWDDVRTFGSACDECSGFVELLSSVRENLCISGGFPCQDISAAGSRLGLEGDQSGLWVEFKRIVREILPRYVFLENSSDVTFRGLGRILGDLAEIGYNAVWSCLAASDVGAPHKRERWWALASYSHKMGRGKRFSRSVSGLQTFPWASVLGRSLPYPAQGVTDRRNKRIKEITAAGVSGIVHSEIKSRVGRNADGLADWMDRSLFGHLWTETELGIPRTTTNRRNRRKRLEVLGNGQVPLCAAVAWLYLKTQLDKMEKESME